MLCVCEYGNGLWRRRECNQGCGMLSKNKDFVATREGEDERKN
jgi:hypothetical protein